MLPSTQSITKPENSFLQLSEKLWALRVGGDSMWPRLPQGSLIVVDLNDTEFVDQAIWVVSELFSDPPVATIKRIQSQYEAIQSKRYEKHLPEYEDENEEKYNKRVVNSAPEEFALLDKENIRLPDAASPVEPCDIFRKEKELIHVKRYGGSSVLSHLFNQGLVSGELLQRELIFRKEFNQKLPGNLKIDRIEERPKPNEYTIVFAIISEQEDGIDLPFFSKISLKHAVNRLEAFGHNVKLAKVPVSEKKKKTQILPPR